MNRITGIGSGGAVAGRPKTAAGASAGGFSIAGDNPAAPAPEIAAAPGSMLSGMLALHEVETETVQDKTARRHGLALLDALSQLHKSLFGTADSTNQLIALRHLTEAMPDPADPGLAAVLNTIRLRAKIELLRRGVEFG